MRIGKISINLETEVEYGIVYRFCLEGDGLVVYPRLPVKRGYSEFTGRDEYFDCYTKKEHLLAVALGNGKGAGGYRYFWKTKYTKVGVVKQGCILASVATDYLDDYDDLIAENLLKYGVEHRIPMGVLLKVQELLQKYKDRVARWLERQRCLVARGFTLGIPSEVVWLDGDGWIMKIGIYDIDKFKENSIVIDGKEIIVDKKQIYRILERIGL